MPKINMQIRDKLFSPMLASLMTERSLEGILGVICLLYAFIWGWQHAKEENITNIMWVWTGLIVVAVIANSMVNAQAAGG